MGTDETQELFGEQLQMDERESISEALTTGLRVSALHTCMGPICELTKGTLAFHVCVLLAQF